MNRYVLIFNIFLFFCLGLSRNDRIVTVGGSVTETVFALGSGNSVVAVDWSSSIPSKVSNLPQVGYLRQLSSEGILSMKPTQILTTSEIGPPKVVDQLQATGIDFHIFESPQSFSDIVSMISEISILLNKEKQGKRIVDNLIELDLKIKERQASNKDTLKIVLFMNPTASSYNAAGSKTRANYLIEYIGGTNVFFENFSRYSKITKEDLIYANPDVILVGYVEMLDSDQSKMTSLFMKNPSFKYIPAIKNNKVFAVDIGKYLNFGPTFVSNAAKLIELIND